MKSKVIGLARRIRLVKAATSRSGGRERTCLATGEIKPEADLIRLALAPDGTLVPDIAAKLPGRGLWISPQRDLVETARRRGGFNRSAGRAVAVPEDIAAQIEARLTARALSLLGLARRSGQLAAGFDAARLAIKAGRPAWRIEASDGAADGREKLDRLTRSAWGEDIPVAGCFSAEELGAATGRDHLVHAVLGAGSQSAAFAATMRKLSGFRAMNEF